MRIRASKLPEEASQTLRKVPAELWEPYQILVAPVYVYLPKNGKFVAVKLPLQCFTDEELKKFKAYENFYLPQFVEQVEPFRQAGEQVRALLVNLRQRCSVKTRGGNASVLLPLAQHELDRAALELIGPLWTAAPSTSSASLRVEPFFLCFFANEVCLPFSRERLTEAIDCDTERFELALLRSSVAVFLALHVGYSDAAMLARIRDAIFETTLSDTAPTQSGVTALLQRMVFEAIRDSDEREISIERFKQILKDTGAGGALAGKLISRLQHVSEHLASNFENAPSIFGDKGICDG